MIILSLERKELYRKKGTKMKEEKENEKFTFSNHQFSQVLLIHLYLKQKGIAKKINKKWTDLQRKKLRLYGKWHSLKESLSKTARINMKKKKGEREDCLIKNEARKQELSKKSFNVFSKYKNYLLPLCLSVLF